MAAALGLLIPLLTWLGMARTASLAQKGLGRLRPGARSAQVKAACDTLQELNDTMVKELARTAGRSIQALLAINGACGLHWCGKGWRPRGLSRRNTRCHSGALRRQLAIAWYCLLPSACLA